jgi:hypothetical protein
MPSHEWGGIEPMGKIFLLTFLFIGLADWLEQFYVQKCIDTAEIVRDDRNSRVALGRFERR